jgi:serine/threonine-protein kinase
MECRVAGVIEQLQDVLGDRYHVEEEIGSGGMATVYLAEDRKHGRRVAIKLLRPELTAGYEPERFLREIRIAARLNHPQILPVHDSGVRAGFLYYVMPYMGGESLRSRLERTPRLPLDEALRITRGVAAALDYAHRNEVVHRDVKPENILLHEGHPIVADFGIARALSTGGSDLISRPGFTVGTPAYMSPEQATADQVDGRSDQYSLACVLYEMLAGSPPFAGSTPRATMARQATEPPAPIRTSRANVPRAVERALARAMAKNPADRFASTAEFAAALETPAAAVAGIREAVASIAVLPFANGSADPDTEYFSDGMTDELINALAKVDGLRVSSRSSVFALKGVRQDVRAVAALLDVSAVLEGSVRRSGSRLRITAQLTSAADGSLLWSERYDREIADVFAVQDEIARTIVSTLRARLVGEIGDPTPRRYTANVKAYQLYLRGRHAWNMRTPESIAEGIRWFEQAIAEDPTYALAYTGLADSHALSLDYRGTPVAEGMRRAAAEARRALELDESLAEAHTSLAWVNFIYDWNWESADRGFRRAIELNPKYASARQWYAWLLLALGRIDEALAQARAAADLDPASVSVRRSFGWLYYYARQPDLAIEHLQRALAMSPASEETHMILGLALLQKGAYAEAEAEFREATSLSSEHARALAALGTLAALQGRTAEARAVLGELRARARRRYVSPVDFVWLLQSLGETDEAFAWLERAYEERRGWMVYLNVEPALDGMRADPRFRDLVRRMRLD